VDGFEPQSACPALAALGFELPRAYEYIRCIDCCEDAGRQLSTPPPAAAMAAPVAGEVRTQGEGSSMATAASAEDGDGDRSRFSRASKRVHR
jgi:hypothetical protein